jgi:4-hydroxy-3-polyprenylbenzoate decarboxylase
MSDKKPQEILTQANALLGYNQVSLTKYLWITAPDRVQSPTALNAPHSLPDAGVSKTIPNPTLSASAVPAFFTHVLERVQWERDLHFITATTMDTLDYTSGTINEGSKLIVAAAGAPVRTLCQEVPSVLLDACQHNPLVHSAQLAMPGVVVIGGPKQNIIEAGAAFTPEQGLSAQQLHKSSQEEMQSIVSFLNSLWDTHGPALAQIAWIVIVDDPVFSAGSLDDFIWTTFLKSNPASDTYGVHEFTHNKHWGCKGPLVTDARTKVHHTTTMICPPQVQAKAQTILSQFA